MTADGRPPTAQFNGGWLLVIGGHFELPKGATLETGKPREELGQLEGRAYKPAAPVGWSFNDQTEERLKVEWVVRAPKGGVVKLIARHERAGTVRAKVKL